MSYLLGKYLEQSLLSVRCQLTARIRYLFIDRRRIETKLLPLLMMMRMINCPVSVGQIPASRLPAAAGPRVDRIFVPSSVIEQY